MQYREFDKAINDAAIHARDIVKRTSMAPALIYRATDNGALGAIDYIASGEPVPEGWEHVADMPLGLPLSRYHSFTRALCGALPVLEPDA